MARFVSQHGKSWFRLLNHDRCLLRDVIHGPRNASLWLTRCKSSYAADDHALQTVRDEDFEAPFKKVNLAFDNGKEAYRSKSTWELLRGLLVFKLCSVDTLVVNSNKLMKLSRRLLGRRLFSKVMQGTFYGHFVAGADHEDIKPTIHRNLTYGVKSILDYSAESDLTEEQATRAEMRSCTSAVEDSKGPSVQEGRFRAHQEFGDRRKNVVSARTYIYEGEEQCDKNMDIFLRAIDVVSGSTNATGFACIKLTALGRPQLLLQLSEVLVHMKMFFHTLTTDEADVVLKRLRKEALKDGLNTMGIPVTRDEAHEWFTWLDVSGEGEIDLFNWSNLLTVNKSLRKMCAVPELATGKLVSSVNAMTDEEEEQMKNMLRRVDTIVEHARSKDVRLMVDAEQTYFQPAISRLTVEMMRKFNKEKAVIFNTYQCYLKESFNELQLDLDLAKRENFCFGAKIVRGAYMEQERERAVALNYEDPINPTYEATSEMYEKVITYIMEQAKHRSRPAAVSVMAATHNEDTVRMIVSRMHELGIHPNHKIICFGQLLGMCDQVSFPLGQAGFSVYKYVPYGPVEEVLPYLSRRALENRGMFKKVKKEQHMMWQEVKRRCRQGVFFDRPSLH